MRHSSRNWVLNWFSPPSPTIADGYTRTYEPLTEATATRMLSWIGPARRISTARRRLRCTHGERVRPRSMWERDILHEHGLRVDGSFRELTGTGHPVRIIRRTVAVAVWFVDSRAVDEEWFRT